jgi:hypothetical protein
MSLSGQCSPCPSPPPRAVTSGSWHITHFMSHHPICHVTIPPSFSCSRITGYWVLIYLGSELLNVSWQNNTLHFVFVTFSKLHFKRVRWGRGGQENPCQTRRCISFDVGVLWYGICVALWFISRNSFEHSQKGSVSQFYNLFCECCFYVIFFDVLVCVRHAQGEWVM